MNSTSLKSYSKIIQCDKCKQNFLLSSVKIDRADIRLKNQTLEVTYFRCVHCKEPYIICVENDEVRKLKSQYSEQMLNMRRYAINCLKNKDSYSDEEIKHIQYLSSKIDKTKLKFERKQEVLRDKYGNAIFDYLKNN